MAPIVQRPILVRALWQSWNAHVPLKTRKKQHHALIMVHHGESQDYSFFPVFPSRFLGVTV